MFVWCFIIQTHIFYSSIFIPAQFSFFFYHISFCMYVQIFVRSTFTSSLRSLVMKQQKVILDYMKLMTSLKFSAVWAKKKAGRLGRLEKKNLIHLPKAQNDFIKVINLKPHMRETFRTMTPLKYWLNFHWCDENEIIDLMSVTTIKL